MKLFEDSKESYADPALTQKLSFVFQPNFKKVGQLKRTFKKDTDTKHKDPANTFCIHYVIPGTFFKEKTIPRNHFTSKYVPRYTFPFAPINIEKYDTFDLIKLYKQYLQSVSVDENIQRENMESWINEDTDEFLKQLQGVDIKKLYQKYKNRKSLKYTPSK